MTEIEIPDPAPDGEGAPVAEPVPPGGEESPYRNLLVPLVVVPALIVMVLVLVFVLFGALAGSERSPRENLDRLLHGGANERQQAAFNLVRQVLEERRATLEGRAPEWDIDAGFLPDLKAARAELGEIEEPDDVPTPLVLASLLAQLGDPEGVDGLIELTGLSDEFDPEGQYRLYAAWTLGAIGPELSGAPRERAAHRLLELFESPDEGLVLVAAAGLQSYPSEAGRAALRGLLAHPSLEIRGTAALSLASMGDAAGVEVLRALVDPGTYAAERRDAPNAWPAARVSESRRKALEALVELGQGPAPAELERMADGDPDAEVRALARELLARDAG